MSGRRIVLTADRSLMTNYRGNFLYGFLACGPYELIPEWVMDKIFCPTVKHDQATGEALVAQCGLRRIESALLRQYPREDVFICHPEYLDMAIGEDTKVVGVHAMDPLGMAPVTTTLSPDHVSYVAMKFQQMMTNVNRLKKKHGFKVVLGGAGAWQFFKPERKQAFAIDHIADGELDGKAPEMFQAIEDGTAKEYMHYMIRSVEEMPLMRGPTINSLVEVMRGCGRGCDFCDVNRRMKKDIPPERAKQEAEINVKYGFDSVWMQSDEFLLYGDHDRDYTPNEDDILRLLRTIKSTGVKTMGTTHLTLAGTVAKPEIIEEWSKLNGMGPTRWVATQPGVETAAPRMVVKHLGYKIKPFSADEWAWVVQEGVKTLNKNYFFPALTFIIGFPDEDPDETRATIDLVRNLYGTKCMTAPLLYQDYDEHNSMTFGNMSEVQFELFWWCWRHNLKNIDDVIPLAIRNNTYGPLMKAFTYGLMKLGVRAVFAYLKGLSKKKFGKTPEEIIGKVI